MSDVREAILARLLVLAQGIPGVVLAARNRLNVSSSSRPAIIIMDGEETEANPPGQARHHASAPKLITMQPVVLLAVGGDGDTVGTTLNAWRAKLLSAVVFDETLASLCSTNGLARYLGCVTEARDGEQTEMVMQLKLTFTYALFPAALTA